MSIRACVFGGSSRGAWASVHEASVGPARVHQRFQPRGHRARVVRAEQQSVDLRPRPLQVSPAPPRLSQGAGSRVPRVQPVLTKQARPTRRPRPLLPETRKPHALGRNGAAPPRGRGHTRCPSPRVSAWPAHHLWALSTRGAPSTLVRSPGCPAGCTQVCGRQPSLGARGLCAGDPLPRRRVGARVAPQLGPDMAGVVFPGAFSCHAHTYTCAHMCTHTPAHTMLCTVPAGSLLPAHSGRAPPPGGQVGRSEHPHPRPLPRPGRSHRLSTKGSCTTTAGPQKGHHAPQGPSIPHRLGKLLGQVLVPECPRFGAMAGEAPAS